jgi:hypothetical protein
VKFPSAGFRGGREFFCTTNAVGSLAKWAGFAAAASFSKFMKHHSRIFLRAPSSRFAKISHNQEVQFYDFSPQPASPFHNDFPQQKWPFSKEIAVKRETKKRKALRRKAFQVSCSYSHSATETFISSFPAVLYAFIQPYYAYFYGCFF